MPKSPRRAKQAKQPPRKAVRRPRAAAKKVKAAAAYFKHPQALVESEQVGPRTRLWAFAHVLKGAVIGADCNICDGVFVEGGVQLGDHVTVKNGVQLWSGVNCEDWVFIGPNATFTNDLRPRVAHPLDPRQFARTFVETGVSIGANATIVAGTRLGRHALIGAGTVVLRDVPPHALLVGNPARQIGWVCACGQNLPRDLVCPGCKTRHRRTDWGLRADA